MRVSFIWILSDYETLKMTSVNGAYVLSVSKRKFYYSRYIQVVYIIAFYFSS